MNPTALDHLLQAALAAHEMGGECPSCGLDGHEVLGELEMLVTEESA